MNGEKVSRRRLVGLGLGAAATATFVASTGANLAHADDFGFDFGSGFNGDIKALLTSVNNAYLFLDQMMDNYANGSTVRLVQSYADQIGLQSSAFTYDNALAICAYLTRGRFSDVARAKVIGDGLLYAQKTEPSADGRFRQAYFVYY